MYVNYKKKIVQRRIFSILAQGPLMITGPGVSSFQQSGFGTGIYPQYGGSPGYSGF